MESYALFFDIDGTLVSFNTHQIPPSTIQALIQAKSNGWCIATGGFDFMHSADYKALLL
jgi:hydroxymethylpyrimidine pyrophosphatase-like HAD family hydrolase